MKTILRIFELSYLAILFRVVTDLDVHGLGESEVLGGGRVGTQSEHLSLVYVLNYFTVEIWTQTMANHVTSLAMVEGKLFSYFRIIETSSDNLRQTIH